MTRVYTKKTNYTQYPIDFYFLLYTELNDETEKDLYEEVKRVSFYCKSAVYEAHNGYGILRASDGKKTFKNDSDTIQQKSELPFVTAGRITEINKYKIIEVWKNGRKL